MTVTALQHWKPTAGAVLRSPFEHRFRDAGARIEQRGAWRVPAVIPREAERLAAVAFTDGSHVAKLEVRGGRRPEPDFDLEVVEVAPGRAIVLTRFDRRGEVLADLAAGGRRVFDMTGAWGVLVLAGADPGRLLRRLGPISSVPGSGAIAGVPGRVVRRGGLLLVLVAVEYAQHVWDTCAAVAAPLGGGPAGLDAVAADDPLLRLA